MNENLDLTEILKDAPKGTKLWSPVYGECNFLNVISNCHKYYPIICREGCFTKDGKLYTDYHNTECVLFPSKENRDWSTFKTTKKHKVFKPFQRILVNKNNSSHMWVAGLYSHYDAINKIHFIVGAECIWWAKDSEIIPYEGNEDKLGQIDK